MRFRILAAALSAALVSCGGEPENPSKKPATILVQEMVSEAVKAVKDPHGGVDPKRPLANAARLAEFLPDSVGGLPRLDVSWTRKQHSRSPTREARATFAKGVHDTATGPCVVVELMDMGRMAETLSGIVRSALDYDQGGESARTFTHAGQRGVEVTDKSRNETTIHLLLSDRLIVEITGRKMGIDASRAALKQVDLAGVVRAEKAGELAQPSALERLRLPSKAQVKAAYPAELFGKRRAQITAILMGGPQRPHIFARALYANMFRGEVRVYKTAAHAAADRPMGTDDASIKTFFGYTGNGIKVTNDTWRGAPIVIVSAPRSGQQAILRIVKGCVALDVRGEDNPEKLKQALDAFEALLSLTPTNGGGS